MAHSLARSPRRHVPGALGVPGLMIALICWRGSGAAERPNLLFIMADDHAANAVSCFGSRLSKVARTPNIDRIAAQGARLTRVFCTNSICVPSRASILTGLYSHRNGVYRLSDGLDPKQRNVAKLLRSAGYETAIIGKWHLKSDPSGFDHFEVLKGQGSYRRPELQGPDGPVTYRRHSTDLIVDRSLRWLESRKDDRPFVLFCHFKAPHEAWQYAPRFAKLYEDVTFPEPISLFEDQSHRSKATANLGYTMETLAARMVKKKGHVPLALKLTGDETARERRKKTYQHFLRAYLRCVAGVDENVGRLLAHLEEKGLRENTVVIYTSDQGYFLGEHNYMDKRWIFEESLQMPTVVRYPKEIAAASVVDDMIINNDFAALLLDYAGVSVPSDMQARSFRANLRGETPEDWRQAMYYRYWTQEKKRPAHYGIRTERYKLIYFHGNAVAGESKRHAWELYDLQKDPKELANVYSRPNYAGIVKRLETQLHRLKAELGDREGP